MKRIISVLSVAALLAAMSVATALPAFAVPAEKVCFIHTDPETGQVSTIEVRGNAAPAHERHGDILIPCEEPPPEA
jgi:hypothetical protein